MSTPVSPDRRERLLARAGSSRLAHTTGYRVRLDDDQAHIDLPYNATLDNGAGAIHGGILCVLVDTAAWYAVAQKTDAWPATIELQARFLEPATAADLTASARVVRVGKRLAVADVQVTTADGRRIATGTATFSLGERVVSDPRVPGGEERT